MRQQSRRVVVGGLHRTRDTGQPGSRGESRVVRSRALLVSSPVSLTRDRWVDALRVGSLLVVVLAHWLMGALTADGQVSNALVQVTWLQPVTWVLQVMPLFFLVGGVAHGHSLESADRVAGTSAGRYAAFVRARAGRLLRPTLVFVAVWVVAGLVLRAGGWLEGSGETASNPLVSAALVLSTQLLWFVGIYLGVAALAPATRAWHRRHGLAAVLVLAGAAATVDLLRFTLDLGLVGSLNFALVWLALHQLGFCWKDGLLTRRVALGMVVGGFAVLMLAVTAGPYPVSMVGIPGEEISNMAPPTLALLAQGVAICGVAVLARGPMTRVLTRPRAWRLVVAGGAVAMTTFLWHLTALMLVMIATRALGWTPPEPGTGLWWATRPVWIAVLLVPTAVLVALFRRFDAPRVAPKDALAQPNRWIDVLAGVGALVTVLGVMMVSITGVDVVGGAGRTFLVAPVTPGVALAVLLGGCVLVGIARPHRCTEVGRVLLDLDRVAGGDPQQLVVVGRKDGLRVAPGGPDLVVAGESHVHERLQREGVPDRRDAADRETRSAPDEVGVGAVESLDRQHVGEVRGVDPMGARGEHQQGTPPVVGLAVGHREDQRVGDLADLDAELLGGLGGGPRVVGQHPDLAGGAEGRERLAHP